MSIQRIIWPFLFFLVLPWHIHAQDITGLWTGYIESSGSKIPYEVVISKDGDKWNGYALSVFTVNEVENIGIKTIEIRQKKGAYALEDHELVFDNYKTPPRRIKMIGNLITRGRDSSMVLEGSFFTRSLDFRSQDKAAFTGIIHLKKRNNYEVTRLTSKLEEMNLFASLSFAGSLPPNGSIASNKPRETNTSTTEHKETVAPMATSPARPLVVTGKESIVVAKLPSETPVVTAENNQEEPLPAQKERSEIVSSQQAKQSSDKWKPANNKPAERKLVKSSPPVPVEDKPVAIINKPVPVQKHPVENVPVAPATETNTKDVAATDKPSQKVIVKEIPATIKKPGVMLAPPPAAAIAIRKTEVIQNIFFTSDSLVLSIYDNGTIDGDTVSVVLNGRVILARKGLTANAIRTTIPVTPDMGDSLLLVMYAENLGSIPPNTGLLIVQDGDQRYDIRFAGDMKKSSAVILRRRR